jgi:transposase-like protein
MYSYVDPCPHCEQTKLVVYWGKNRGGTQRLRGKDCNKTLTV